MAFDYIVYALIVHSSLRMLSQSKRFHRNTTTLIWRIKPRARIRMRIRTRIFTRSLVSLET